MATRNSINNVSNPLASTAVTVDPGASGDSAVQYSINGTPEFIFGIDDTDGDALKLSQGSALGTTDTFTMSAAGECNLPLQPAFLAHLASTDSNVTGSSTPTFHQLGSGNALTEIFDLGGDFNTNGTFTAPVTGRYFLYAEIKIGDTTAAMSSSLTQITTSNRVYYGTNDAGGVIRDASNNRSFIVTAVADMDASDTATVEVILVGAAGNTADVLGQATDPITYFCGYLAV